MEPASETLSSFSSNNHDEDRNLSLVTPLEALCLLCCYCHTWRVSKEFYFPVQILKRTRAIRLLPGQAGAAGHYQHKGLNNPDLSWVKYMFHYLSRQCKCRYLAFIQLRHTCTRFRNSAHSDMVYQ